MEPTTCQESEVSLETVLTMFANEVHLDLTLQICSENRSVNTSTFFAMGMRVCILVLHAAFSPPAETYIKNTYMHIQGRRHHVRIHTLQGVSAQDSCRLNLRRVGQESFNSKHSQKGSQSPYILIFSFI